MRTDASIAMTAAFIVGAVAVGIGYHVAYAQTEKVQVCTVDSKERAYVKDGDGIKPVSRVFTDCGVFDVKDDPLRGQWNSADTYGALKEGGTYELTTFGWRNGFLSWFPNITKAEEANQ